MKRAFEKYVEAGARNRKGDRERLKGIIVAAFKNLQPEDMKVVMAAVHKELGIGGKTK